MKKIATYVALSALLLTSFSCKQLEDIEDRLKTLEEKVAVLEQKVTQANSNIEALQKAVEALTGSDWVVSVSPIVDSKGVEIGYTLTFHSGKTANIYHGKDGKDGADGRTPVVQALKDTDGIYYWHVDGEWLRDEYGNKIPVTGDKGEQGVAPILKIVDDYWYISYDGTNWTQLGKAVGEDGEPGEPGGDSIFSSVVVEDNIVVMTLHNGEVIKLPIGPQFTVKFESTERIVIVPGCKRVVNFSVTSTLDTAYYEVFSSEDIKAKVVTTDEKGLEGYVEINASEDVDLEYAKLLFFASDGYSLVMKRFAFEEDRIEIIDDPMVPVPASEGLHTLRFMSNSDYTVEVDESAKDWITIMDTKMMTEKSFTFYVKRNEDEPRRANITVRSVETGLSLVFTVSQEGLAQIFSFSHNLKTVTAPDLTGNTTGARIKFGDGSSRYWQEGLTYTYKDELPEHTVSVIGQNVTGFSFDQLTGLTGINLKDF